MPTLYHLFYPLQAGRSGVKLLSVQKAGERRVRRGEKGSRHLAGGTGAGTVAEPLQKGWRPKLANGLKLRKADVMQARKKDELNGRPGDAER